MIVFAWWLLFIYEPGDGALAASGGRATGEESIVAATVEPTPTPSAIPTPTPSPTVERPTCADLASVRVSYRMMSETYYGLDKYWPRVTVDNGSEHLVEATISGWMTANSSLPDFPLQAMWANHRVDVPQGGTGMVDVGLKTGDYLSLPPGEEILDVHLTAYASTADGSLSMCEVEVVPGT
jgi:hypothetical protein